MLIGPRSRSSATASEKESHRSPVCSSRRAASIKGSSSPSSNPIKGGSGELPVQAPDKFTLSVNLRAAKTISLTLPQHLIARADEVIE
jgi:hypothetical protein